MYRHDPQLTGRSRLACDMKTAPRRAAAYFAGRWETLIGLESARRTTESSVQIPKGVVGAGSDLAAWQETKAPKDLDGDGQGEVIQWGQPIKVLSSATGEVLWSHDAGSSVGGSYASCRIAKLAPELPGLQATAWGEYTGPDGVTWLRGIALAFDRGARNARVLWQREIRNEGAGYAPTIAIADVDADGRLDVVMVTWYSAYVFDGATGQDKYQCRFAWGRNYGYVRAVNLDADPYLEVVVISDFVLHVDVLDNDGEGLKVLWREHLLPEPAQRKISHEPASGGHDEITPRKKMMRIPPQAVLDADGDGRFEIIYNFYNDAGDERWHVVVRDALTGAVDAELPGAYVNGIDDVDGDGAAEFFVQATRAKHPQTWDAIRLLNLREGRWVERWRCSDARWLMRHFEFPDDASLITTHSPDEVALSRDLDGDGIKEFFAVKRSGQGEKCCILSLAPKRAGVRHVGEMTAPPGAGVQVLHAFPVAGQPNRWRVLAAANIVEGAAHAIGANASLLAHERRPAVMVTPIAADVDADGRAELIVQDSLQHLVCLSWTNGLRRAPDAKWRVPGMGMPSDYWYFGPMVSPTALDMDGDGRPEIVCQREMGDGSLALVMYDASGSLRWQHTFKRVPFVVPLSSIDRWLPADLNGDGVLDLYVSRHSEGLGSGGSLALDGRNGRLLWQRDNVQAPEGPERPLQPTAWPSAYDWNKDGAQDILLVDGDIYCVLDGRSGKDLRPPIWLSTIFGPWSGYSSLVIEDFDRDGRVEAFTGRTYGLHGALTLDAQRLWHVPLTREESGIAYQHGVGDVNGDGRIEVGRTETDGLFHCRDAATGAELWALDTGWRASSDTIAADVDGDGRHEFLFGSADGHLVAVSSSEDGKSGRVLWAAQSGGSGWLSHPIVADFDGDGLGEIACWSSDGFMYVFDGP